MSRPVEAQRPRGIACEPPSATRTPSSAPRRPDAAPIAPPQSADFVSYAASGVGAGRSSAARTVAVLDGLWPSGEARTLSRGAQTPASRSRRGRPISTTKASNAAPVMRITKERYDTAEFSKLIVGADLSQPA